jgi:hypothetical protein
MTKVDLKTIKNFTQQELAKVCLNEDWTKLSLEVVTMADRLRDKNEGPVVLSSGYTTAGHATDSLHYQGKALDLTMLMWIDENQLPYGFPNSWKVLKKAHNQVLVPRPLLDQYILAERFANMGGLGVYPNFNLPGLHIDCRPADSNQNQARWWRDTSGTYQYLNKYEDIKSFYLVLSDNYKLYIK